MKKLLYCAAALATMFFAGSCQRENFEPAGKGGAVTFTVTAPGELDTRATTIANGENVNVVHYAVYKTNPNEDYSIDDTGNIDGPLAQGVVPMNNKTASVELDLLQDQDYTILFWAQKSENLDQSDKENYGKNSYYDLGDLREVSVKYEVEQIEGEDVKTIPANDESRAAFFQRYDFNTESAQNYEVKLVRPFAQINLGTTLASLKPVQEGQTQGYEIGVKESEMTVKGIASSFSLVTGEGKDEAVDFTFTSTATPATTEEELFVNNVKYHYVGMNYLVIPIEDKTVTVSYGITTDKGNITNTINNVPVKENFRTNIIGNLLTSKTDFEIVVDERFNKPDIKTDYVWGGETKAITPFPENGVNVYYVNDASELAWVAEQVNTPSKALGKTFEGEIVRLNDDINLEGNYWIPIGNGDHSNRYNYLFAGTFDGNGKTIRNMKVEYPHCAGLIGRTCGAVVKDLTIDGFDLDAEHYAGAIIGWAEQGSKPVIIENCTVLNGNIKVSVVELENGKHDLGDKAGAIVGYSHHGTYTDNAVENVSITGYRDLGGIVGYGNNSVVTGNTVSEVTLYQDLECDYKKTEEGEATPTTLGDYIGRIGGTCTIEGNTGAVETSTSYFVTDEDAFLAAAKDKNAVVNVPENTTFDLPTNIAEGVTIIGSEGSAINFANKISSGLNNVTFKNLTIKEDNGNYNGIQHSDYITYEDCVIEGVLWVYSPNTTFTNCTFKTEGDVYAVWLYGGGKSVFTDCNFETGLNKAILVYNESSLVYDVTVDGCSFKASECAKNKAAVQMHTEKGISGNLLINNSTTENFYDQTGRGTLWSEVNNSTDPETPTANFSVTVDGVQVARAGYTQLAGYSNLWTKDGQYYIYDLAGLQDFYAFLKANTGRHPYDRVYNIMNDIDADGWVWNSINVINDAGDAKGLVLNGNGKTISNLAIAGEGMFTSASAGAVIKNITMDGATVTSNSHNAAIFWGSVYSSVSFENVAVKNSAIKGYCNTGAFVGGTYEPNNLVVTFTNCSVENSALTAAGYELQDPTGASGFLGKAYGSTKVVFNGVNTIDNATTITNQSGLVGGKVYGYTTWVDGGFAATGACDEFTNFDGVEVVKVGDTVYGKFTAAVKAAKAGDTISLVTDVTLSEELMIPAGVILNGNGKQINGSIYAGGDLTFAGHTKVTSFSASYYNRTITIGVDACLEVTGTDRVTLGYGNTFDITGNIEKAKTADKATVMPSLIIPGGISITGGNDATMNVTNAYVQIGPTSSKNSVANGKFTLNIENSIAEFTNQLTFAEPTSGKNPTFNLNVNNSVLTTATKLCIAAPNTNVVIDNSTVTLGSYLRNSGTLTLKNGSTLTGATIQFGENGGNNGTINVDASELTIATGNNKGNAFDGKGVGVIDATNGAKVSVEYYKAMTIYYDTTSTFTGTNVQ